jgi:very-short-patch-repair endonuclease
MREKSTPVDAAAAEIAAAQHGVISIVQLRAAGISDEAVRRRVEAGRLHRLHRGVYAVGHTADSWQKRWTAAVLACGDGAALSHMSAAALWGLLRPKEGPVDVSVPHRNTRKRRDEIRLHRSRSLAAPMTTRRHGIPVTTPARTIEDLRGGAPPHLVRRATRQAELANYRLGPKIKGDRTRSDLERDFLRLCRRTGIPAPEVNVKVGRWTVDFLWREQRIAVETDFYDYHRGRVAFRDDRARELDLRRHGLAVHRFSEEQVNDEPEEVAADLREALGLGLAS